MKKDHIHCWGKYPPTHPEDLHVCRRDLPTQEPDAVLEIEGLGTYVALPEFKGNKLVVKRDPAKAQVFTLSLPEAVDVEEKTLVGVGAGADAMPGVDMPLGRPWPGPA